MTEQTGLGLEPSHIESGPVECLGLTFESEDARREHFLELLAEKLKDPEFRATPGFPKGSDEDILRLSDPPYYTACPNPFLDRSFSEQSVAPNVNTPYAADFSVDARDPIYLYHPYHTKGRRPRGRAGNRAAGPP